MTMTMTTIDYNTTNDDNEDDASTIHISLDWSVVCYD